MNPAILLLSLFLSIPALAQECGYEQLRINGGSKVEKAAACEAIGKIVTFFDSIGVRVHPKFELNFSEKLSHPKTGDPLFGYFDSDTGQIFMLTFNAEAQKNRKAFLAPWSDQLAKSFLIHEMAHMAIVGYMGEKAKEITPYWHEAMAYSIQIETMDKDLQDQVLLNYRDMPAFDSMISVNGINYGVDPHAFAIQVYKALDTWGGGSFIKDVMDGKVSDTKPFFLDY